MTTQTDEKQVGEDYILQYDFTPRLLPGETIDSVDSVDTENQHLVDSSVDITISAISHDDTKVQAKASGGTNKEKYLTTCFVNTSLGSRLECEQYLLVRNKP